jgi:hypothetical protein
VSCAAGLPRGYLHWQAHACMCAVCSRHAHIIYLFTHIHSIPLVRTHAAEVLGDSAAITVYWSEGVRTGSYLLSSHMLSTHTQPHTALSFVLGVVHQSMHSRLLLARPPAPYGWCVMSGEWHARLGYLHWQAHACMCAVCSRHAHIYIYLFTHIHSIPLVRTHAAEVRHFRDARSVRKLI